MANSGDGLPKKTLLYACSGAANTGYLADQVARLLARQGAGEMTCLVSMGANQPTLITEELIGTVAAEIRNKSGK